MKGEDLYERYLDSLYHINKMNGKAQEWKQMGNKERKVWNMLAEQLKPKDDE